MEGYDLEAVARLIAKFGFKRVAIQFPDEQLHLCVSVYEKLGALVLEATSGNKM